MQKINKTRKVDLLQGTCIVTIRDCKLGCNPRISDCKIDTPLVVLCKGDHKAYNLCDCDNTVYNECFINDDKPHSTRVRLGYKNEYKHIKGLL